MIDSVSIRRINELARKQKTAGLSEQERREQAELRRRYLEAVRASLRAQLDQIEFVDPPKS